MTVSLYRPKHRRGIFTSSHFDASPSATCTCTLQRLTACPRHDPATYADFYARHATDSIGTGAGGSGRKFW